MLHEFLWCVIEGVHLLANFIKYIQFPTSICVYHSQSNCKNLSLLVKKNVSNGSVFECNVSMLFLFKFGLRCMKYFQDMGYRILKIKNWSNLCTLGGKGPPKIYSIIFSCVELFHL